MGNTTSQDVQDDGTSTPQPQVRPAHASACRALEPAGRGASALPSATTFALLSSRTCSLAAAVPGSRLATQCPANSAPPAPLQGGGIRLFKYMKGSGQGGWEVVSTSAELDLFDENQDSSSKGPAWHLTVEGGQDTISTLIDDQFSFEPKDNRVTFVEGEDVWALRFPSAKAFDTFLQKFNGAMFENRFGEDTSKADKVSSAISDCGLWPSPAPIPLWLSGAAARLLLRGQWQG